MTKTLTEILAGEDMEGGEVFCDSVYNFLKNKDRAQNIFTNSGFGVWSQSDANKGIGVVKFDTGSTAAPAVGATVTGANGAKAKVIRMFVVSATWGGNTATGYVILGACGLNTNTTRFADNEILTYAGGTITVNYPDTVVQLSVTAATIAFNDADPDTITDTGAGFGGFAAGDVIEVSGSGSNNGFYWVAGAVAATLTLHANESLTAEPLGTTVTITRRGAGDWVRNGDFSVDIDPPRGWTAVTATLTTEAGGKVGNCMQVASSGAALGKAYQDITTIIGKIYKLSLYFEQGTSSVGKFMIGIVADEDSIYDSGDLSDGAWAPYSHTFEATAVTTRITMQTTDPTATENSLFDEISLYEITPCCTEGDVLAFDGWYKDSTLDIYRQYYDGDTLTKHGSFYSLKCVPSAVADNIVFPGAAFWTRTEWYQKFMEKTVTIGIWAKAFTASHFRIMIYDGAANFSSYHTGGGDWEWLEVTHTIPAATNDLEFQLFFSATPNVDGSTIVYVSQPMLAPVPYIGEGNYQPRQQEIVDFEDVDIQSQVLFADGFGDVGITTLNLKADSDAIIPKGAKAIFIRVALRDGGSLASLASGRIYLFAKGDLTSEYALVGARGIADDAWVDRVLRIPCDSNGNISYQLDATGAGELDVYIRYIGVQIN